MPRPRRRRASSKSTIERIDFRGVPKEIRKRGARIPEGDYLVKIVDVERKKGDKSGLPYYNWKFQVVEDAQGKTKHAGVPLYYVTSLKPEALFNLRNLIHAATEGKRNPAGRVSNFDRKSLIGKQIGVTVEDDEFDGKIRSRAVDVMPKSQLEAEEEEEEEDEEEEYDEEEDEEDEEEEEDDEEEDEEEEDEEDEEDEDELDDVDLDEDL
jgi:hypothetical protein